MAELRHEWLFAAGVALAVCSVLTPTMLLWGVKNGLVMSLRERLLRDPRIREIRPMETVEIPKAWVEEMRNRINTGFIVPSVRQISLYGRVRKQSSKEWVKADEFLPSGAGDPVADDPQMAWPVEKSPVPCVVSQSLAETLDARVGEAIAIELTRAAHEGIEKRELPAVVLKIVPRSLSPSDSVYLPLGVIERIEDFRDGQGVPAFGWPDLARRSIRRFHGCVILSQGGEDEKLIEGLRRILPAAKVERVSPEQIFSRIRVPEQPRGAITLIEFSEADFDGQTLDLIASEMASKISGLVPFVLPVDATTSELNQKSTSNVTLRTASDKWLSLDETRALFTAPEPRAVGQAHPTSLRITSGSHVSNLKFLLRGPPNIVAELSPSQSGVLGASLKQPLKFDEEAGTFRYERRQYAGFRLYAKSLEDVPEMRRLCETAGYRVQTKEGEIDKVKSLDASLSKVFYLIGSLSAVGGFGALFASLYLSVERGKRQFSVLRVLGASNLLILSSIVIEAVVLVSAGTFAATALYFFGAVSLQRLFGGDMLPGEIFCRLGMAQLFSIWMLGLFSGVVSGLLAALRLRGLDAAVMARGE